MNSMKILVIEDNSEMRENIAELLELSSYEVDVAINGKEGVKKALVSVPDLIICDIMMPEMDGYETLSLLSRNPKTMAIPFIFLTAKAEKEDFRKGMDMGADDYLVKPFDHISLINTVQRRLEKHQALLDQTSEGSESFIRSVQLSDMFDNDYQTQAFAKKEYLYRAGDFAHYVYLIKSGEVKTYKINEEGKEFIHSVKKAGEFLGQHAVITDSSHVEFAKVLEDTEVMLIPRLNFQELVFNDRNVSAQFIKLIAQDVMEKENDLLHLAYDTVRKRTVDSLIELSNNFSKEEIHISRDDLSNMVGTASETVIRVLSELKRDKILSISQGVITIDEPEKLEQIRY